MRARCLMLGPGKRPVRRKWMIPEYSLPEEQVDWVSVDIIGNPTYIFDLNRIERGEKLPAGNEEFDEIHAYSVLNLYGTQGDYKGWFTGWREFWRVLKPGGYFVGGVPLWNGEWVFGDPATRRVIQSTSLMSLTRDFYSRERGACEYESLVDPCWWEIMHTKEEPDVFAYYFGLKKVK